MSFRKGTGTKDADFQLRTIAERVIQVDQKIYTCFVDYQKVFDRVYHEKVKKVVSMAGIPSWNKD
jgi:hypothetical protein